MATGFPDFEGGKRGLYSQGDWSVLIGEDKTIVGAEAGKTFLQWASVVYPVPAGKTLYIAGLSWFNQIELVADVAQNALALAVLFRLPDIAWFGGGVGGDSVYFSRPLVFEAGVTLDMNVLNGCNASCQLGAALWGWEV